MVSFSVLIITHGREELLLKCLNSLRPPIEKWQIIIVANGMPLSNEVIQKAHSLTSEVDILNLEKQQTPGKSRNEGIKLAHYDWVYLIDDDAYVYPRYFEIALPLLEQDRVEILGGPDSPAQDMDTFSEALAVTLTSPFCTGKTFSRHRGEGHQMIRANEQILTSCNLWIRTKLLHEVKFPENYLRTEETALLLDLETKGVRMFYHPDLKVGHHRRKNLISLFHPTFYGGYYRAKVLKEKIASDSGLFWLPAMFVLMHLLVFISPAIFWTLTRIYLGLIVMMSLNLASRRKKWVLFPYITILHYFIIFFYGLGFLSHRLGLRENR